MDEEERAGSICLLCVFTVQLTVIVDVNSGSFRSAGVPAFSERACAVMFAQCRYLRALERGVHEIVKVNSNERQG